MNEADVIDTESFQFSDHQIYFQERDNPEDMRVYFRIGCRKCGSYIITGINLKNLISYPKFKSEISRILFKYFKQDIPESCLEAKQLGIINSVHNC